MINFKGYRIIANKVNALKFYPEHNQKDIYTLGEWRPHADVHLDSGKTLVILCDESEFIDLLEAIKEKL